MNNTGIAGSSSATACAKMTLSISGILMSAINRSTHGYAPANPEGTDPVIYLIDEIFPCLQGRSDERSDLRIIVDEQNPTLHHAGPLSANLSADRF